MPLLLPFVDDADGGVVYVNVVDDDAEGEVMYVNVDDDADGDVVYVDVVDDAEGGVVYVGIVADAEGGDVYHKEFAFDDVVDVVWCNVVVFDNADCAHLISTLYLVISL